MKIETYIQKDIEFDNIDITPQEMVKYILHKANIDYDSEFIKAYFNEENWLSSEEVDAVRNNLSKETKKILKLFIKSDE